VGVSWAAIDQCEECRISTTQENTDVKLRLAIVGAGPAGIYAADILLKYERAFDVSIDLFERLPAPYGLVRPPN